MECTGFRYSTTSYSSKALQFFKPEEILQIFPRENIALAESTYKFDIKSKV